jgi:hypothetical protein
MGMLSYDAVIRSQGALGLAVLVAGGLYLLAILVPLTARASVRSRLLLSPGAFAKVLSALLFSVPGVIFSMFVLLLAAGGAVLWLLQPIPRLYGVEAVGAYRMQPGNDRLVLFVGGWDGAPPDLRLVELMARDAGLRGVDLLTVDYVEILAARRPPLIELAQGMRDQVHRRLADPRYRAVVLVGHSVGGLLARWWAAPAAGGQAPPVVALVDLAVPKAGVDIPSLAAALGLPAGLLAELGDGAGFAGGALRRWRRLGAAAGLVHCFHGDLDPAVPRDSAFSGCARRHDELDADHRTIAAPASAEALAYRRTTELVAAAFSRATTR